MEHHSWEAIHEYFDQLTELDPEAQQRELESIKHKDPKRYYQIRELIKAHNSLDSFLEKPFPNCNHLFQKLLSEITGQEDRDPRPNEIGPYKVVRLIGRGGMGVVYLCKQLNPERLVAIKTLKIGKDLPRESYQRFEAEAQALARMRHRYITQVYQSGKTTNGRPFLVMEFIDGVPITDFCKQNKLSLKEQLLLFIKACEGVLHAHTKGIIHRDLKPSNILVTRENGEPVPKIIDFGIARAIYEPFTDNPLQTAEGSFIGTPAYMSPEQTFSEVSSLDTRSDIYSLGSILYQILTGQCTIDLEIYRSGNISEKLDLITKKTPLKPSSRIKSLRNPNSNIPTPEGQHPHQLLKGDLDAIVMKSLYKEPQFRYLTVSDFISDILNYMEDRPILARRPTNMYVLRKYYRRYRPVFLAFAIGLTALVSGLGLALHGWWNANQSKKQLLQMQVELKQELHKTEAHNQYLDNLLSSPHPSLKGLDIKMVDLLADASESVDEYFAEEPGIRVFARSILGKSFSKLGYFEAALKEFSEAYEIKKNLVTEPDGEMAILMSTMARSHRNQYQLGEARAWYQRALLLQELTLGKGHITTLETHNGMARTELLDEHEVLAELLYRRNLHRIQQLTVGELPVQARCRVGLGQALMQLNRYEDAEDQFGNALRIQKADLDQNPQEVLITLQSMAFCLLGLHRYGEAASLFRKTLDQQAGILHDTHPYLMKTTQGLGLAEYYLGNYGEALIYTEKAVQGYVDELEPLTPNAATALRQKSTILKKLDRTEDAVTTLSELGTLYRTQGKERCRSALIGNNNLGHYLLSLERTTAAIKVLTETLIIKYELFGNQNTTLVTQCTLAEAYQKSGNLKKAEQLFAKTYQTASNERPEDQGNIELYRAYWGQCLGYLGQIEEAGEKLKKSRAWFEKEGNLRKLAVVEKMMNDLGR